MSEKEIRSLLRTICADLDRSIRKALLPTALGASLALGACSDDSNGQPDTTTPDTAVVDAGHDQKVADQKVPDGALTDQRVADQTQQDQQAGPDLPKWDFWPPPPYMAPDAAPLYLSLTDRLS